MKPLSETAAKKQVSQLQAAIIDGLEDVKAQNIQVFDTTELTPLFERVIIASGSSSRQTKALAASVRDKVREAGFNKPSIGGEDNGEWVTVDCGAVVAHIMQPAIRDYYRLEEIWGEKPVKLAAKKTSSKAVAKTPAKAAADNAQTADGGATPAPVKTSARKTTSRKAAASPDAATPVRKTATKKTPAKTATKATTKTAAKAPAKSAVNKAATKAATKSAAKTATAKAKSAA